MDGLAGATVVDLDVVVTLAFSAGATFLTGVPEKRLLGLLATSPTADVGPSTPGPILLERPETAILCKA